MNGGASEYMAAFLNNNLGKSGFIENPVLTYGEKYFDIYYINNSDTEYNSRILGDATGELGPFYYYDDEDSIFRYHNNWWGNSAIFISNNYPWLYRGGDFYCGKLGGQISFTKRTGEKYDYATFRIVLAN
jgi:hypothetical protein